jgi:hypothetical protein
MPRTATIFRKDFRIEGLIAGGGFRSFIGLVRVGDFSLLLASDEGGRCHDTAGRRCKFKLKDYRHCQRSVDHSWLA